MQTVLIVSVILHGLSFVLLTVSAITTSVRAKRLKEATKKLLVLSAQTSKTLVETMLMKSGMNPEDLRGGVLND